MITLAFAAVIATMHLDVQVPVEGGDYQLVPFEVPAGTAEIQIARSVQPSTSILDFGVWNQDGWRGYSGGLTDAITVGVAESSRGYQPGPIAPGTWQLLVGKAKLDGAPASFGADITFLDAGTLPVRPRAAFDPTPIAKGATSGASGPPYLRGGPTWWRGDLHVHSRESGDAKATFDEIIALARSRQLDFVVLSDHNTVSQHALIAALRAQLPDLLLVRGNEVTTYHGHGNALGVPTYVDHRVGLNGRTATGIIHDVNAAGGLFVINHPNLELGTACIGCAWKHADTPWSQVGALEVSTGNYNTSRSLFFTANLALWDQHLDEGARIAAVGGSDDHRAGQDTGPTASEIASPTTLVWADELSEPALVAAIKAGRTQVALRGPDDPQVELFAVDAGGRRAMIGDTIAASSFPVEAHVVGGDGTTLVLVENGVEKDRLDVHGDDWTGRASVQVPAGGVRVRAQLYANGTDPLVVTSHLYAVHADGGGCAVTPLSHDLALGVLVAFALALALLRFRRRA